MGGRARSVNQKITKLKRELKEERERIRGVLQQLDGLSPENTRHCRQWFWLAMGFVVATLQGDVDQDHATFQQGYATWLAHFYYRLMHEGQSPESGEMLMAFLVEQGLDDVHDVIVALDEEWVTREMAQPEKRAEQEWTGSLRLVRNGEAEIGVGQDDDLHEAERTDVHNCFIWCLGMLQELEGHGLIEGDDSSDRLSAKGHVVYDQLRATGWVPPEEMAVETLTKFTGSYEGAALVWRMIRRYLDEGPPLQSN